MRAVFTRITGALLAASLCAAPPGGALAADAAAPTGGATWGVVARGGYYGVPDAVAGEIFHRHPEISGWSAGAELRYYGADGPRGVSSFGLAFDHGYAEAAGIWQAEESDDPAQANGSATMDAVTLTAYWDLLPSWRLHPFVGLGLGVAYFEGEYEDEDDGDIVRAWGWLPVLHVPVGLTLELGEHARLSAEARFIDGFAAGGALQLWF